MKRSSPWFLFLLAFGCASVAPKPPEPVRVVIVGTTDVHGWFNGRVETPPGGGEGVLWGGLPALASYVEVLRKENDGRVIVVDSGDMFQGTLESNLFEGEAVVRGYNVIGYAAAAVGNHEFDFGPVGPDSVARKPGDDPLGALKRNAELATFPLLSANMFEKANGKTPGWARPYTIVRAGAARIGIIGLSTPDTPNVTMAANVVSLNFTDPVAATLNAAKELRAEGVDAVIVIAHMGGRCTKTDEPHNVDSCETQHEVMDYLAKLPKGTIDAYFAGHTHSQMRHYVNGVPTLQGGAFSREFSTLDLWIDTAGDKVTRSEIRPLTMICTFVYEGTEHCDPRRAPAGGKLVPRMFGGAPIEADKRVAAVIDPFLHRVAAKREEKLGIRTAVPVPRSYTGEAPLGNLIADAMREWSGADIAFMNSGGIRAELPAGELIYADVFAVSPFDNYVAVARLTGQQVLDMVTVGASGQRGIFQTSGLRYTVDASKEGRDRIVAITLASGEPLKLDTVYNVAMPDFVAAGGDGTQDIMKSVLSDQLQVFHATTIREVLIEQWKKEPQPLAPRVEGRITVINRPAAK